jgi:hypothetical protein
MYVFHIISQLRNFEISRTKPPTGDKRIYSVTSDKQKSEQEWFKEKSVVKRKEMLTGLLMTITANVR